MIKNLSVINKDNEKCAETFNHGLETLITRKGDILKIRMSYNSKQFFVRSAFIAEPKVDSYGKPFMKLKELQPYINKGKNGNNTIR